MACGQNKKIFENKYALLQHILKNEDEKKKKKKQNKSKSVIRVIYCTLLCRQKKVAYFAVTCTLIYNYYKLICVF